MRISQSNKLIGKVTEVKPGQDMAEIIIDIGDFPVHATISKTAAQDMDINPGDEVFALFNATDVTLIKDSKNK